MSEISFKLEKFEGPLDLLLHLIDKNKVNIYDIPIVEITNQYMAYIDEMKRQDLNVLSEFLPDKIFDAHMHLFDSDFLPNVFGDSKRVIAGTDEYIASMNELLGFPKTLRINIIPFPADI